MNVSPVSGSRSPSRRTMPSSATVACRRRRGSEHLVDYLRPPARSDATRWRHTHHRTSEVGDRTASRGLDEHRPRPQTRTRTGSASRASARTLAAAKSETHPPSNAVRTRSIASSPRASWTRPASLSPAYAEPACEPRFRREVPVAFVQSTTIDLGQASKALALEGLYRLMQLGVVPLHAQRRVGLRASPIGASRQMTERSSSARPTRSRSMTNMRSTIDRSSHVGQ